MLLVTTTFIVLSFRGQNIMALNSYICFMINLMLQIVTCWRRPSVLQCWHSTLQANTFVMLVTISANKFMDRKIWLWDVSLTNWYFRLKQAPAIQFLRSVGSSKNIQILFCTGVYINTVFICQRHCLPEDTLAIWKCHYLMLMMYHHSKQ